MSAVTPDIIPAEDPQARRSPAPSAGQWLKKNLFSSLGNSITTIVTVLALGFILWKLVAWILSKDFGIIRATLRVFMIGSYPDDQLWRLWVSGVIFAFAIGFIGGALARNAYQIAVESEIEASPDSIAGLLRRFWVIIAILYFFAAFARTIMPAVLVTLVIAMVVIGRLVGWHSPQSVRSRATYITALLVIVGMMATAGTSSFGGFCIGFVLFLWVNSEVSRSLAAGKNAGRSANRWIALGAGLAVGVIAWVVISQIGFEGHGWKEWGGLMVNIFTAIVGVSLGMPLGILLALGRRSELPVIKSASVLFIEFVRGVPLISLLIFSIILLPLFLPPDWETPTSLTLAIVVIMFFSAAYIAEIVRGGLQAVAKGQTEAGQALGLKPGIIQRMIVLPQALRAVIPAMVGQFIALFKDTSLLFAASVTEFLQGSTIANTQPEFLGKGLAPITLAFVALGFWAFSYTMSRESRRLEQRLGVGTR